MLRASIISEELRQTLLKLLQSKLPLEARLDLPPLVFSKSISNFRSTVSKELKKSELYLRYRFVFDQLAEQIFETDKSGGLNFFPLLIEVVSGDPRLELADFCARGRAAAITLAPNKFNHCILKLGSLEALFIYSITPGWRVGRFFYSKNPGGFLCFWVALKAKKARAK